MATPEDQFAGGLSTDGLTNTPDPQGYQSPDILITPSDKQYSGLPPAAAAPVDAPAGSPASSNPVSGTTPEPATYNDPLGDEYLNRSDLYSLAADTLENQPDAGKAFATLDSAYHKSDVANADVLDSFAEIGQAFKENYGIDQTPQIGDLLPPLHYSAATSVDDKEKLIDDWTVQAKHKLQHDLGSEYVINKWALDEEIDGKAKALKREIRGRIKFGTDPVTGRVAADGKASDLLARAGIGLVSDTASSLGMKKIAKATEDHFTTNSNFDQDTTSELARLAGFMGGAMVLGTAATAITGGSAAALGITKLAPGIMAAAEGGDVAALAKVAAYAKRINATASVARAAGQLAPAGAMANMQMQQVYETVYRRTGNTSQALSAEMMAAPVAVVDYAFTHFVAGKLIGAAAAKLARNQSQKVDAIVAAVEGQTTLEGVQSLRAQLQRALSSTKSKLASTGIAAAKGAAIGSVGFPLQNVITENAVNSNIGSEPPKSLMDIASEQGHTAFIGAVVGGALGGAGGYLDHGKVDPIGEKLINDTISRLDIKERDIKQAEFDALGKKGAASPEFAADTSAGVGDSADPILPPRPEVTGDIPLMDTPSPSTASDPGTEPAPAERITRKAHLENTLQDLATKQRDLQDSISKAESGNRAEPLGNAAQGLGTDATVSKEAHTELKKIQSDIQEMHKALRVETLKEDLVAKNRELDNLTATPEDLGNKAEPFGNQTSTLGNATDARRAVQNDIREIKGELGKLVPELPGIADTIIRAHNDMLYAEKRFSEAVRIGRLPEGVKSLEELAGNIDAARTKYENIHGIAAIHPELKSGKSEAISARPTNAEIAQTKADVVSAEAAHKKAVESGATPEVIAKAARDLTDAKSRQSDLQDVVDAITPKPKVTSEPKAVSKVTPGVDLNTARENLSTAHKEYGKAFRAGADKATLKELAAKVDAAEAAYNERQAAHDELLAAHKAYNDASKAGATPETLKRLADKLNKAEDKVTALEADHVEVPPPEAKPAEAKPTEAKPTEAKPAEAKPAEAKPTDIKPAEVSPQDALKALDAKVMDTRTAANNARVDLAKAKKEGRPLGALQATKELADKAYKAAKEERLALSKSESDRLRKEDKPQSRAEQQKDAEKEFTKEDPPSYDAPGLRTGGVFMSKSDGTPVTAEDLYKTQDAVVPRDKTTAEPLMKPENYSAPKLDLTQRTKRWVEAMQRKYPRIRGVKDPLLTGRPKKLPDLMQAFSDLVHDTVIRYQKLPKTKEGTVLGSYYGRLGHAITSLGNDLETAGHEMAHALDHAFDIVKDLPKDAKYDKELHKFAVHGTSYPDRLGRRIEGIAEYVRAFIRNPEAAKAQAPEFHKYLESKLPKEVFTKFAGLTKDLNNYIVANGEEVLGNHIQRFEEALNTKWGWVDKMSGGLLSPGGVMDLRSQMRRYFDLYKVVDFTDKLAQLELNFKTGEYFFKNDPVLNIRALHKFNGKIAAVFKHGIPDPTKAMLQEYGKLPETYTGGGLDSLFKHLTSDKTKFYDEMHDSIVLGVAKRTIDIGTPLEKELAYLEAQTQTPENVAAIRELDVKLRTITGVSGQLGERGDMQITREALANLQKDPERYARLEKSFAEYQKWTDGALKYRVAMGDLTQKAYDDMVSGNPNYVGYHRIKEDGPNIEVESGINPLKYRKGGTERIKNPYVTMVQSVVKHMHDADVNHAKRSYVDMLSPDLAEPNILRGRAIQQRRLDGLAPHTAAELETEVQQDLATAHAVRDAFGGPKPSGKLADIANKLEVRPDDMKQVLTIKREGVTEYWKFNDRIMYQSLHQAVNGLTGLNLPGLHQANKMFKFMTTHSPGFLIRNPFRDAGYRMFVSSRPINESFRETFVRRGPMDHALLQYNGGDQAGLYARDSVDYARALHATLEGQGFIEGSTFLPIKRLGVKYSNLSEQSELTGRLSEFGAQVKNFQKEGYTAEEAYARAGDAAAGNADYTSAGIIPRIIENIAPFTSAGSVIVRNAMDTVVNDKKRALIYGMVLGVLPKMIERSMAQLGGYEKELDQKDSYLKSFYTNIKYGPDQWLRIPMSYELGILGDFGNRVLDFQAGKTGAFDGFWGNAYNATVPFNPLDSSTPFGAFKGALSNYDAWRQQPIVPVEQESKRLGLRPIAKNASTVGAEVQRALVSWGLDDSTAAMKFGDARKIDYIFSAFASSLGRDAISLADIADQKKRGQYIKRLTGVQSDTPAYTSRDSKFVREFASSNGLSFQNKKFSRYLDLQEAYFNADPGKPKEEAASAFTDEANRLRLIMESDGADAFLTPDTIRKRATLKAQILGNE